MKKVYNLILLCMLLSCQQNIVAQSYKLGNQRQSFSYETLYATPAQMSQAVESNNETTNTQPTYEMATKAHHQIKNLVKLAYSEGINANSLFKYYNTIYKSVLSTNQDQDIKELLKIQTVIIQHIGSKAKLYPNLENQLEKASSMKEQIDIFLSYYNE